MCAEVYFSAPELPLCAHCFPISEARPLRRGVLKWADQGHRRPSRRPIASPPRRSSESSHYGSTTGPLRDTLTPFPRERGQGTWLDGVPGNVVRHGGGVVKRPI